MITDYDHLPIGSYLKIRDICEDPAMDEVQRQASIIAVLSGRDTDSVLDMPLDDYMQLAASIRFLERPAPPQKPRKQYNAGPFVLVPVSGIRHMTAAQYIDFQGFSARKAGMVEQLSCFLVPKGCRYGEGYDTVEVQQAIRDHMTVADAMSLNAFFLRRSGRSMLSILTSCWAATGALPRRERRKIRKTIVRTAGHGFAAWTRSARHAAARGTRSGAWASSSSSTSSPTPGTRRSGEKGR